MKIEELPMAYLGGETIKIDFYTWREFKEGKRDTIDHLVDGGWVEFKPLESEYIHWEIRSSIERMKEFAPEVYARYKNLSKRGMEK